MAVSGALRRALDWVQRTWSFDPLMVFVVPLALVFYLTLAVGPLFVVLFWDRPPLVVGVIAALLGFGVLVRLLVEGSTARLAAVMSQRSGDEFHTLSVASVLRALLATGWLVLATGIWSAAIESHTLQAEAGVTLDYVLLAVWHIADVIPLLNVPSTLGYPSPPISSWGLGTGVALLLLGFGVVISIVLVVGELVVRRSRR